jgi:hypothetical protein
LLIVALAIVDAAPLKRSGSPSVPSSDMNSLLLYKVIRTAEPVLYIDHSAFCYEFLDVILPLVPDVGWNLVSQ